MFVFTQSFLPPPRSAQCYFLCQRSVEELCAAATAVKGVQVWVRMRPSCTPTSRRPESCVKGKNPQQVPLKPGVLTLWDSSSHRLGSSKLLQIQRFLCSPLNADAFKSAETPKSSPSLPPAPPLGPSLRATSLHWAVFRDTQLVARSRGRSIGCVTTAKELIIWFTAAPVILLLLLWV